MRALTGEVYAVTGGAGAIAKPILEAFVAAGAKVAVVDVNPARTAARAQELGGLGVVADLGSVAGAERMCAEILAGLGRLDGVICTAGGFAMGPLAEASEADYARMFDLNVRTLFCTVRAVLPRFIAAGRGFVCGFSSEPGLTGASPGSALYGAAKSAVATLLHSLDRELVGGDIKVAVVYPMGAVDTPANRRDMPSFDAQRYIDPLDIAETIVSAAQRSPRARVVDLAVYPRRAGGAA